MYQYSNVPVYQLVSSSSLFALFNIFAIRSLYKNLQIPPYSTNLLQNDLSITLLWWRGFFDPLILESANLF